MSMIESPAVILYDANGVAHAVRNGVAIPANTPSLLVAGTDGTNARNLAMNTGGLILPYQEATFTAYAANVSVGNNKSLFSLFNANATVKIKLREVWMINVQSSPTTGVVGLFELRKITGHSGGTLITPIANDSTDTLDADVTARTGATVSGEGNPIGRRIWSTDDWGPGSIDTEALQVGFQQNDPAWDIGPMMKPFVLNQNEGIHVKFTVSSSNGTFDMTFVFTQA